MWRRVPFACQRRPIVGVLRMCWLLPGSFDCFCCPHTSVHRPSIACLAVFLCGPGALFLHALSGPSTICSFPPHGWSAPDGLPLLLRKQPIWAAGDTPHLMPVEQGLPWHPVATGLAGQAIPFIDPPPPGEGSLSYCMCAQAAVRTKRRKKLGSAVAIGPFRKTIDTQNPPQKKSLGQSIFQGPRARQDPPSWPHLVAPNSGGKGHQWAPEPWVWPDAPCTGPGCPPGLALSAPTRCH